MLDMTIIINDFLSFRLLGQRQYDELSNMLYEGALTMLNAGEVSSGVDLTKLLLDVLHTAEVKGNEQNFQRVAKSVIRDLMKSKRI